METPTCRPRWPLRRKGPSVLTRRNLLKRQAAFDQHRQGSMAQKLSIGAYVPPFLKITAKNIKD